MADAADLIEWDEEAFAKCLEQARDGVIDVSSRRVSSQQLARLLGAAPRQDGHHPGPRLRHVDFTRTTFTGDAGFWQATFTGDADFTRTTFAGEAHFSEVTFSERARFDGATFSESAGFDRATFTRGASFNGATFSGYAAFGATFCGYDAAFIGAAFSDASFGGATFTAPARFSEASFSGFAHFIAAAFGRDAIFSGVAFGGRAGFDRATFGGRAGFDGATFAEEAEFADATCQMDVSFQGASFERATVVGPVHVFDRLWLDEAVFARRVKIEASALRASFAGATFRGGADVRLRWAEVWLEDCDFAEPSLITNLQARQTPGGHKRFLGWESPREDGTWECSAGEPPKGFAARVLSVRGARVARLTLSGLNLERCQFSGAHGLDQLTLERVDLPHTPDDWRWNWGQPLRWTRRRTIAEEHRWRKLVQLPRPSSPSIGDPTHSDLVPPHPPPPDDPDWPQAVSSAASRTADGWPPEVPDELGADQDELGAEQIAGLYRALRKGHEDIKDSPGANDFYYGEMEMRRRSAPSSERAILWLYWLVSGYGLRAGRALIALGITIAVLALALDLWGFRPDRAYGRALLFSLESSISLLRAPEARLTAAGEVSQIVLRLAGPLFFGLALLALRGRVKR